MLNEDEEQHYRRKCRELKARIGDVDSGCAALGVKLARTKKYIRRLRLERSLLLDKFERVVEDLPANANAEAGAAGEPGEGSGVAGGRRRVASPTPPKSPPLEVTFYDAPIEVRLSPPRDDSPNPRLATPSAGGGGGAGGATPGGDESAPASRPAKKKRDPNEPKRPKNAFLRFCETEREAVRAAVEAQAVEGDQIDIAREMGRVWSGMDDLARRPYYEAYEEDKKRYEREYADYTGHKPPIRKSRSSRPSASTLAINAAYEAERAAAAGDKDQEDSVMGDADEVGTPAENRSPSNDRSRAQAATADAADGEGEGETNNDNEAHTPPGDPGKDAAGQDASTTPPGMGGGGGFTPMNR